MPHDQAYLEAEKKIEEALKSGTTKLNLSEMNLAELPESLGQLIQLERLILGINHLEELPNSLANLIMLKELNLYENELTALPNWIESFAQLERLEVSLNQLKELPESLVKLTQIKYLSVSGNQLTSVPEWIGDLVSLEYLGIGCPELSELPNSLGKLKNLRVLVLGGIDSGASFTNLPLPIAHLENLEGLHVNFNNLTDLPLFIVGLRKLTELSLEDNPLNPELAKAYKKGLNGVKRYLQAKAQPGKAVKLKKPRSKRQLKVFLCHASQDKPIVHELYQKFITEGWIEPWLDAKKLLPGQDWQAEIKNAVETADNVLIFLSNTSINKDGFIQKELRLAKDIALEKAEGSIFLIPLRLDDCEVPKSLQLYQWANYFGTEKEETYSKLLESLRLRLTDKRRKEPYTKQGTQHV